MDIYGTMVIYTLYAIAHSSGKHTHQYKYEEPEKSQEGLKNALRAGDSLQQVEHFAKITKQEHD